MVNIGEIILTRTIKYALNILNKRFSGDLADLRFCKSTAGLTGANCCLRVAGEKGQECLVYGITGNLYDGDNAVLSGGSIL